MEGLALKLEILKGPRKGETLEYRPGSKIRIGRVVRGNNLPIKDSGISTNHLLITSAGRWLITDLHSSNGTILNAAALAPDTPVELRDGDEIKIGEQTSIAVKIEEEENRLRRNPRRAAAPMTNRSRRGKAATEESEEVRSEVVEKPKNGRGRPARKTRVLKSVKEEEVAEASSRAVTSNKNVVADSENCDVECEEVRIEPKRRTRTRRIARVNTNAAVSVGVIREIDDRVEVSEQKNFGESSKASNLEDERRHEEAVVGCDVRNESGNANEKAKDSNLNREEPESGDKVENGSGSGVKERLGKIRQEEPDLEKMSLDDWFDYVEVSWPEVVNAKIDKICVGMREKARLVQEYIAQHKKEKGQS